VAVTATQFVAFTAGTAPCGAKLVGMGVFFFIGGLIVVAGGSLAALYYLVGSSPRQDRNERKRHPAKRHLLSHWR
jgi:hypothetical protein